VNFTAFFEIAQDLEYLQTNQLDYLVNELDDVNNYNINALREIESYLERCRDDTEIDVTDVLIFCQRMIEEMEE
tara:strand:+ start:816 stop:1037 length:222 start_codon:yes stop_codon:yes gene_type:complete